MKKFALTIPKPCHENWDGMTPEDKGRFCGACQKTVIDFRSMSDRELAQFFKKPLTNACGHFHADQLNRAIEIPRKRIPWLKYFFTISLPAFLLSLKATAQREVLGNMVFSKVRVLGDSSTVTKPSILHKPAVKGRIRVKPPVKFKVDEIQCTSLFPIPPLAGTVIPIKVEKKSDVIFESLQGVLGGISFSALKWTDNIESSHLLTIQNKSIPFSKFTVFPNPVSPNAAFTIDVTKLEGGQYDLLILSSAGEIMQTNELVVDKESKAKLFTLRHMAAGPYFIRLTHKKNATTYTEIIIVQ